MAETGGSSSSPPPPPDGADGDALLVVVLVGLPGSGKSTFCDTVMSGASRSWARICQDTIGNGKSGTKLQCIKAAEDALKDGKSVLIDRCNMDRDQRADFVNLHRSHVSVHAVVLDLPAKVCISRSVQRTGHEGNLQGGKAAAVVNRMLQKKEPPAMGEGFTRIMFCQDDNDVKNAISMYRNLGPLDVLPPGVFGQKSKGAVQVGIMKFLKKIDAPHSAKPNDQANSSDGNHLWSLNSHPGHENLDSKSSVMMIDEENECRKESDSTSSSFSSCSVYVPTLAFPSISTADFQFNMERASEIIVDVVSDFLQKIDGLKLALVDISPKSRILSLVKEKATKKKIDSDKFLTFVGDITQLKSKGGLQCNVIANAANWRLKPGGGGVNAAIYNAAGEELEHATKQRADTLSPGNSLVVPLPPTSPLCEREGVTHIIHVLGPNMNPLRPNYLRDDYDKGCEILRQAYISLFENFAAIFEARIKVKPVVSETISDSHEVTAKQSSASMQNELKNKRVDCHDSERTKKYRLIQNDSSNGGDQAQKHIGSPSRSLNTQALVPREESREKIVEEPKKIWGSWALALHGIAMHPEKHKEIVLEISDDFIIINDLYPKARKHILVVARLPGLDSLMDVNKEHLPLLKTMHSAGAKWVQKFLSEDASMSFRLGYHSVPSMRQLHLHVISQDFDSACLKNKKHWNSFTTAFFRDSVDVIEEIERDGGATIWGDEKLLAMELRCHKCRSAHPNLPKLKSHIMNCRAPFPADLHRNGRLVSAMTSSADQILR